MDKQQWELHTGQIRFEPPDLGVINFIRDPTLEDMRELIEIVGKLAQNGPYYIVVHLAGRSLTSEVRKEAAHIRPEWFKGAVMIGAGTAMRLAVKSIHLAMALFGR